MLIVFVDDSQEKKPRRTPLGHLLAPPSPAPRGDLPPPLERDRRSRRYMSTNDKITIYSCRVLAT